MRRDRAGRRGGAATPLLLRRLLLLALAVSRAAGAADAAPAAAPAAAGIAAEATRLAALAEAKGKMAVAGSDGFLFLAADLRHLGRGPYFGAEAAKNSAADDPAAADPLPVIADFARALKERGVDLLLVPVPPKPAVYADRLFGAPPAPGKEPAARVDGVDAEAYRRLAGMGVDVLDLAPALAAARADDARLGPVYCRQDTHWSGRAIALAAAAIAQRSAGKPWRAAMARGKLESESRTVEITGDLWQDLPEPRPAKEKLALRFVGTRAGGALVPLKSDRASPVVLLGDSHTLVFDDPGLHAVGAGLASALALELGGAVDNLGSRGSGGTSSRINFLRRARETPGYLSGKKLVVWCFAARELSESTGWKKLALPAAAAPAR